MRFIAMFLFAVLGIACDTNDVNDGTGNIDDSGYTNVDPGDSATLLVNTEVNDDELTDLPYCFMHNGKSVGAGQTGIEQPLPDGYDLDEIEIAVGDKDSEMTVETVPRRIITIDGTEYVHRTTQPDSDDIDVQLNRYLDIEGMSCEVDNFDWDGDKWVPTTSNSYIDQYLYVESGFAINASKDLGGKIVDAEMSGDTMVATDSGHTISSFTATDNSLDLTSTINDWTKSEITCVW